MGTTSIKLITSDGVELAWGVIPNTYGVLIRNGLLITTRSDFVVGALTGTDNAVARYDGTSGRLLQNSLATIDDSGNMDLNGGAGILTGAATALRSATTNVVGSASAAPTAGQVPTATSGTAWSWQTPTTSNSGTATLAFGASPVVEATVVVTGQAWVTANSEIHAYFMAASTAGNGTDEHLQAGAFMRLVVGDLVVGVGFTIYAYVTHGYVTGDFTVCWEGS